MVVSHQPASEQHVVEFPSDRPEPDAFPLGVYVSKINLDSFVGCMCCPGVCGREALHVTISFAVFQTGCSKFHCHHGVAVLFVRHRPGVDLHDFYSCPATLSDDFVSEYVGVAISVSGDFSEL